MARVYNFSAGPAALPEAVLQQAQESMLDYAGLGVSICEISHRSAAFMQMAEQTQSDLRQLLGIGDDHAVLFSAGGATTVQALLPLNFADSGQVADYVLTGHWSGVAMQQAQPALRVHVAGSSESEGFCTIVPAAQWQLSPNAAYVHFTDNETIGGVQYLQAPQLPVGVDVPLVADMSSSIASAPLDISRFAIVYAGAQKNLGIAGITVLIVRKDMLARAGQPRANIFNYNLQHQRDSMLNTPPTWNWYVLGLNVRWMLEQGGVHAFAQRNAQKAALLYECIDASGGFYRNQVPAHCRSRMNVPFFLANENLDALFLQSAQEQGFIGLKGHKVAGGMRASLYNAQPLSAVEALVQFMRWFMARFG